MDDYLAEARRMMGQNMMPSNFGGSVADLIRQMMPNGPPPGGPTFSRGGGMGGPPGGGGAGGFRPTPGMTIQDLAPLMANANPQGLMRFMPGATIPRQAVRNPNFFRRPGVGPTPY